MIYVTSLFYSSKYYIIYLRKSRSDDPSQTVEEVLSKHETMLQEYAERELGGRIPESNIYREVVSGESISERVEIQKVLARMEDPNCLGVLVIEPQRLSRGDLLDCGKLINWLQDTHTLVVTPIMSYNLENKMERKFFQDELMRGRDYLEYVCEIMMRGKIAAVKRGSVITDAPTGYYKVQKARNHHTLEIDPQWAPVIRMIFNWYAHEGVALRAIPRRLKELGIKTPKGRDEWQPRVITKILSNRRYIGLVTYNERITAYVIENGERKKKRIPLPPDDPRVIVAQGDFAPLIDMETWELAQARLGKNPKYKSGTNLKNVLAGLMVCSKCGYAVSVKPHVGQASRYQDAPRGIGAKPCFKSIMASKVIDSLIVALEQSELPNLKAKARSGSGTSRKIQEDLIASLETQLKGHKQQLSNMYELREQDPSSYPPEIFAERSALVNNRIKTTQEQIDQARASMPAEVDYQERAATLEQAIALLKDPTADVLEVNRFLKTIIDRIVYTGTPTVGSKWGENECSLEVFLRL